MKYSYKRTFDAVDMPPASKQRIRAALSSHRSEQQMEESILSIKPINRKKSRVVVIVAAVALSVTLLAGFTFGSQIMELLGGGRLASGTNSDGSDYVSMDMGFASDPAEVRNGQVYFVLDGLETDITNYCSEESYYQFELTADNGYRHIVLVGGEPENLGWAEFIWNENGDFIGGNATTNEAAVPNWLQLGQEALNVQ